MTFSQYVLDQRLALAYRKLRDPRFSARTISSVAHDAGFGDLSYFNRTFRRRYGIAPSDARRIRECWCPGSAEHCRAGPGRASGNRSTGG